MRGEALRRLQGRKRASRRGSSEEGTCWRLELTQGRRVLALFCCLACKRCFDTERALAGCLKRTEKGSKLEWLTALC